MKEDTKICLIHYFTGTGNTFHLVKTLERELQNKEYQVQLINVEKEVVPQVEKVDLQIFAFPVYGFGTPSIMLRYASKLRGIEGSRVGILCTSGGFEGQSLYHLKLLLKHKGAEVIFTDMIRYTYNWTQVLNPQSKEIEQKIFKEAQERISVIVEKLQNKQSFYKKMNWFGIGISWIVYFLFTNMARRLLGKMFVVDNSCNGCGTCARSCPAKVIHMEYKKPKWNVSCESCQRCINMCPQKSIQLSVLKLFIVLIFELVPIFIFKWVPLFSGLPGILNIFLFMIMFLANTVIAIYVIAALEKVKVFNKLFCISYTKRYRRNIADGFRL